MTLLCLVGCATQGTSQNAPQLTGDKCAVFTDQASCDADAACEWDAVACPNSCTPGQPCPPACPAAECFAKASGGSGSSGSGSGSAACACANGEVCYEQVGGPAQMDGTSPQIECILPAPGTGDACARIQGEGTCSDSATVGGLCICDNGIR